MSEFSHFIGGTWISDYEYMDALQNRNKTNLLDALGVAPPEIEEPIPETFEKHQFVKNLLKQGTMAVLQETGLASIPSGISGIIGKTQRRAWNTLKFQFSDILLPIEDLTREILMEMEEVGKNYPIGSAIGSAAGGAIGFALGMYIGGPLGGQIGAFTGQTLGFFGGAEIEKIYYGSVFFAFTQGGSANNVPWYMWGLSFLKFMGDVLNMLNPFNWFGGGGSSEPAYTTGGAPPITTTGSALYWSTQTNKQQRRQRRLNWLTETGGL